ncbi:haloacid dehalogenase [Panus rudis PR-1116 ss-1]|nr:haloacid dehalogenase [Panus rudis PR-1116 ss-1]
MSLTRTNPLADVEAFVFDVFGTVVDWHGGVSKALQSEFPESQEAVDWVAFTREWIQGHYTETRKVAEGGTGSTNVDVLHRKALDALLISDRWNYLAKQWDDAKRNELVLRWHKLEGWPDTTEGLYLLKKKAIIGTLSNGNARLLVDMAKNADLPWDIVLSGDILGSYKPNPKMYLGAAERLSVTPSKVAMVAAHIYDVRAAATHGMKTVYVRRTTEDTPEIRAQVEAKADGGEFDVVVDSLVELAKLLG